ncbi:hypothetical protein PMAYCL1PPCAC_31501, partial [Pristionchus mayeri]
SQIMFCLSFLDMVAIVANCILFGYLLIQYVNVPHAVHNLGVAACFCLMYMRAMQSSGARVRIINNMPVLFKFHISKMLKMLRFSCKPCSFVASISSVRRFMST